MALVPRIVDPSGTIFKCYITQPQCNYLITLNDIGVGLNILFTYKPKLWSQTKKDETVRILSTWEVVSGTRVLIFV